MASAEGEGDATQQIIVQEEQMTHHEGQEGETQLIIGTMEGEQIHTIVGTQQGQDGHTVITAEDISQTLGQPVTIVSTGGEVGEDGSVTITMVQAVDESGQIQHHQQIQEEEQGAVGGQGQVEQKVKIMSVTSGQSAAEQIAAALAEAVAGTEEEAGMISHLSQEEMNQAQQSMGMEQDDSMGEMEQEQQEIEISHEPWNEEGCLVCNKDIKFDDPLHLQKPNIGKIKEFFLEYLAVGDNIQLEAENVYPFCDTCTADLEKLMLINRKIEHFHKEFNRLRNEVAQKAIKTYITRAKPDWLEEDLRTEAYASYFPDGEKPKTHKEQLLEVWKNRYELIQPGPKGPMMIRSMDSRGRVTVVRLNSSGQPIPERQLASNVSNLSRVIDRNTFEDDDSSGMELYKCRECPKTFTVKAMLDYHMKIHSNANKPFKCNECGKGFAQRGGLITHSLVHTGAKPYVCQVCQKAFRQKYHLTQHNLIHSGVKPFSCEICHKSFNVKMNLREHMRRHTGDRPYKCPFCTIIGFFRKKMLKEHITKSHPEEEMPEELLGTEPYIQSTDGNNEGEDGEEADIELDAADQVGLTEAEMLDETRQESGIDVKVGIVTTSH